MSVYTCRASFEDDRPQIDFNCPETAENDWLIIGDVLDALKPASLWPAKVVMKSHSENATQWDCFMAAGTRGVFSKRFVEVIGKDSLHGLSLLPSQLNGVGYYFLRCERQIECFDHAHSTYETFRSNPARIKYIRQFAFHEHLLPKDACFCIPETKTLLLTEPVAQRIRAAGLRGVFLEKVF